MPMPDAELGVLDTLVCLLRRMKDVRVLCVLCVFVVVCAEGSSIPAGIFPLVGGSTRAGAEDYVVMKAMGSTGGRVYGSWSYIQRNVTTVINPEWTLAYVQAHGEACADAWATSPGVNWANVDMRVDSMAGAVDHVVLQLGGGFTNSLPAYKDSIADPNTMGKDSYLAYMYVYSFAAAKRYVAKGVHLYQIENELNAAYLASLAGQRRFQIADSAWHDWDFLTQLLTVLKAAAYDGYAAGVKTLAPEAAAALGPPLVTQNVVTDVPKWIADASGVPKSYYEDSISEWAGILDWVSMDAYPNMFIATPCLDSILGERVANAISVLKGLGMEDKPVMIMETNYPSCGGACNASTTYPAAANFTLENQATCMASAVDTVFAHGGQGFFFFTVAATAGITPPPGGYNEEDLSALAMIAKLYESNVDPAVILGWIFGKGHLKYLESPRFADMLGGISAGSGAMDMDGTYHPVVQSLKEAYARVLAKY